MTNKKNTMWFQTTRIEISPPEDRNPETEWGGGRSVFTRPALTPEGAGPRERKGRPAGAPEAGPGKRPSAE